MADEFLGGFLAPIVRALSAVPGVAAIVLGGSRGTGAHDPASDYDIGLYYAPENPINSTELSRLLSTLDDSHRQGLATVVGGWGPWINGGAWLKIAGRPIDIMYRDLGKVTRVIEQCHAGHVTIDYQPGHPFGFVNAIF